MKNNYRNCTVAGALALFLVPLDAQAQGPSEPLIRLSGHVLDACDLIQ
jgi:hypothetical protein